MSIIKKSVVNTAKGKVDVHAELYDNAQDVVRDCRQRPVRIDIYDMSQREIRNGWHGVGSYDEALGLLAGGYQPTVEALRSALKVKSSTSTRFTFVNEPQGFIPVVPLALKNVPNCMIDMRMRPIKSKVLDVYYDVTANCDKEPEQFIKAGNALLSTIIGLERQGYRFNLYSVQSYGDRYDKTVDFLCVKVKSSNTPLDLKRISFPLTHPAFFRVIGFDWEGKSPITRDIGTGRGTAITNIYTKEQLSAITKATFGDNSFYVACTDIIDKDYNMDVLKAAFTNTKPQAQIAN